MKEFVKTIVTSAAAAAASVIGMVGGAWLWSEVLEPKLEEFKEFKEAKKQKES